MVLVLVHREKIMTTPRRDIKRELRREEKAVKAAVLDKVTYLFSLFVYCLFAFISVLFLHKMISLD